MRIHPERVSIPCWSGRASKYMNELVTVVSTWQPKFQSPVGRGVHRNKDPLESITQLDITFQSPVGRGVHRNLEEEATASRDGHLCFNPLLVGACIEMAWRASPCLDKDYSHVFRNRGFEVDELPGSDAKHADGKPAIPFLSCV